MNQTIGDVRTLEGSGRLDIEAYLQTVDLSEEERADVVERYSALAPSVRRPVDSPVPLVVDGWLG